MTSGTQARAERRSLLGAALAGAGMGLGLGAAYLAAGLGQQAAEHQRAARIAEAAVSGYDAANLQAVAPPTVASIYAPAAPADAQGGDKAAGRSRAAAGSGRTSELECLTQAVYYEARGEDSAGQFAVAQVVMNRVKHPAFPDTVCGVVFQGAGRRACQFSFACDGSMRSRRETLAWKRARRVAARVLSGAAVAEIGSATHFHTTAVAPAWGSQMRRVAQVGVHVFYRFAPRRAAAPRPPAAEPVVQNAILTATPAAAVAPVELKLGPVAFETPAAPGASAAAPEPAPAPAPAEAKAAPAPTASAGQPAAEAAALKTPPPASAGAS